MADVGDRDRFGGSGADDADDATSLVDAAFGAAKPKKTVGPENEKAESEPETAETVVEPEAEPALADTAPGEAAPADAEPTDAEPAPGDAAPADAEPAAAAVPDPHSATRRRARLLGAAAVVAAVGAASVLVLTGSSTSSGSATAPTSPTSLPPSVNPQAFYPATQNDTPFSTGATSSPLTDEALRAAVPGCDSSCKLVTRANGFSPDGAALALFRTGAPVVGKPNFKLVAVGADGKLIWSAPDGVKALTAGIERFTTDKAGNFYLALPGSRSGYILIVLAWRNGAVADIGDLLHPKVASDDAVVGVLPEPTPGATATIVAQTRNGVSDATTGGLIESQYQVRDGVPVLIGCRRHVGESGEWITFKADPAKGCVDAPPGPVGPPDGDEAATGL